jgi:5-methylthioadenosine/S-adenosylhomocysteine deaminase
MLARPPGGRVVAWPGPVNVVYCHQDVIRAAAELARDFQVGWHTHLSAPQRDPGIYLEEYGRRPAQWLHDEGLLGAGATMAHAVWVDDAEITRLGETWTGVCYCPVSNQYVPMGVFRLRDLRDSGATVALGTDGSSCGHRQDLFEVMKQAILVQRVHTLDPTVSNAEEAVELATREGARYLGIDGGVLAPGKLADVVVVDLQRPHLRPLHRTVATLAYAARGSDVAMTIVGGEIVYEDGRCTRIDEAEVMMEAKGRARDLIARAGMDRLLSTWNRARVRK